MGAGLPGIKTNYTAGEIFTHTDHNTDNLAIQAKLSAGGVHRDDIEHNRGALWMGHQKRGAGATLYECQLDDDDFFRSASPFGEQSVITNLLVAVQYNGAGGAGNPYQVRFKIQRDVINAGYGAGATTILEWTDVQDPAPPAGPVLRTYRLAITIGNVLGVGDEFRIRYDYVSGDIRMVNAGVTIKSLLTS